MIVRSPSMARWAGEAREASTLWHVLQGGFPRSWASRAEVGIRTQRVLHEHGDGNEEHQQSGSGPPGARSPPRLRSAGGPAGAQVRRRPLSEDILALDVRATRHPVTTRWALTEILILGRFGCRDWRQVCERRGRRRRRSSVPLRSGKTGLDRSDRRQPLSFLRFPLPGALPTPRAASSGSRDVVPAPACRGAVRGGSAVRARGALSIRRR